MIINFYLSAKDRVFLFYAIGLTHFEWNFREGIGERSNCDYDRLEAGYIFLQSNNLLEEGKP